MNNENQPFFTPDENFFEELSRDEILDLVFLNELKSFGKDGIPNEKFVRELSQKLSGRFRELYIHVSKEEKIEFFEAATFSSWQKFFFPLTTMVLLLVIVSLGFANVGEYRVKLAEKNNKESLLNLAQKSAPEKILEENAPSDSFSEPSPFEGENIQNNLALEIDAMQLLMNEQENDLEALDGDLAFYEESVDGDFSLIENDLETIFQ